MKMTFSRGILFFVFFLTMAQTAAAWNQGTHRQINYEAVQLFLSQMEGKEKFELGPITEKLRTEPYRGIAVTSSGLLVKDYQIAPGNYTMPQWVMLGGDWADEPHLHASVRHFYDPLSRVKSYLTDQWQVHGVLYESPGINAKTWGLDHPDNPFSFKQGLIYYKLAMEVREDAHPPGDPLNVHFKTNLILDQVDPADQRRTYLALAYRSLGETMHMLGDMTQPAHVRNDAHPLDEPIESRVFSEHVRKAAADRLRFLDPRITPFLASAGGGLQWPEQLFDVVAAFTNKYFYSADTIYDQPLVIPNNYSIFALPYPEPQFADLKERHTRVQGYLIERRVKRYEGKGGAFEWMTVPMAQERLSFHWFDPDQSIWIDAKEAGGRFLGNHGRYHIPNAYAPKQARVLLPIAIYANADLMDMFFPTMELTATFTNEGIQQGDAPGKDDYSRYVIHVDAEMVHHQQRDPAWSEYDLLIEYTGPATLIISEDDEPIRKRELHFIKGTIDKIEMPDGTFSQRDLELYATLGERSMIEEEAFYLIENNQSIHVEIKAGTRHFQTEPWLFEAEQSTVTILPPRIMIYEMAQGATEVIHDFEASGKPDDVYRFEWDFGDGTTHKETRQPGERSQVSHSYTGLKDGDEFHPRVELFSQDGQQVLATDSVRFYIEGDDSLIAGRYQVIGDDGEIIRDVVTGLEWQRCALGKIWDSDRQECGFGQDLHTWADYYTWEEAIQLTAPGGFRTPTIDELRTLVYCSNTGQIGIAEGEGCGDGNYSSPTIVTDAFPDTVSGYWSASPYAEGRDFAWRVNFYSGRVGPWITSNPEQVRLVRGGQ